MDFSFLWIPTLFHKMTLKRMQRQMVNPSRYTSTQLGNTLHLHLDLMEWVLWREWPGQKALNSCLTISGNALFTAGKSVKRGSTWIKSKKSAHVCPGLYKLIRCKLHPCKDNSFVYQDIRTCNLEKETCVASQALKDEYCLVPCRGLYADISDVSLKQNMRKGNTS